MGQVWSSIKILSRFFLFWVFLQNSIFGNEQPFIRGKLPNGLTYYIHRTLEPKKQISIDYVVKVGALYESDSESGYSYLVEHLIASQMYFKGKKLYQDRDSSYPVLESFTSYLFTQFYLNIPMEIKDGLEEGLLGLSNALFHLSWNPQLLQEEQKEILQEIRRTQNNPLIDWRYRLIDYIYPAYQLKSPLGLEGVLEKASIKDMDHFYRRHYQPDEMAIIVIGPIDLQETRQLIEKYFSEGISRSSPKALLLGHSRKALKVSVYSHIDAKATYLSLIKPLPKMSQWESLIFSLVSQLLIDFLNTSETGSFKLFIPEVSSYPRMFRLLIKLSSENPLQGLEQLQETLRLFFEKSFTVEELEKVRARIREGLTKMKTEDFLDPALSNFYRDHFVLGELSLEFDHPNLRETLLNQITPEKIHQAIQQFKEFSHVSLYSSPDVIAKASLYELDSLLFNTANP